jgi:hypothetical protein
MCSSTSSNPTATKQPVKAGKVAKQQLHHYASQLQTNLGPWLTLLSAFLLLPHLPFLYPFDQPQVNLADSEGSPFHELGLKEVNEGVSSDSACGNHVSYLQTPCCTAHCSLHAAYCSAHANISRC